MEIRSYQRLAGHITRGLPLFVKMNFGDFGKTADERLRHMVRYAYENVDLYRLKYDDAGVKPQDIRGTRDLGLLPLITKKDLVEAYRSGILSRRLKPGGYYMGSTSGSTGAPVRVFKDMGVLSTLMTGSMFLSRMAGSYLGMKIKPDSMMYIFVDVPDSLEGVIVAEKTRLPSRFFKQNPHLDALRPVETHIHGLNEYKPDILVTYPSVLRNMAVYAARKGIKPHQPQAIMVTGELLDPNTRRVIKRVFDGELINFYAATECGVVAMECRHHTGMHVKSGSSIIELVRCGKPVPAGETGEIVVTDLWNEATPIIRYAGLGDVGQFAVDACPCGSRTPRLKVIEGRKSDAIELKGNVTIHPFSLTLALEHIPGIARFQIVQEETDAVRAIIVPEDEGTPELAESIAAGLAEIIQDRATITVDFVQEIPRLPNGQNHRVVISRIAHPALV
jgi:phenylacetate-CoA ligase